MNKKTIFIMMFLTLSSLFTQGQDSINKIEVFYNPVYNYNKNFNGIIVNNNEKNESIQIHFNYLIYRKFSLTTGLFSLKSNFSSIKDTTFYNSPLNEGFHEKKISLFIKILINYQATSRKKSNLKVSLGFNNSFLNISYIKDYNPYFKKTKYYYNSGVDFPNVIFELSSTYTFYPIKHFGIMARPFISTPSFGINDLTYGLGIGITYR